ARKRAASWRSSAGSRKGSAGGRRVGSESGSKKFIGVSRSPLRGPGRGVSRSSALLVGGASERPHAPGELLPGTEDVDLYRPQRQAGDLGNLLVGELLAEA